jgi:hypothetical protein
MRSLDNLFWIIIKNNYIIPALSPTHLQDRNSAGAEILDFVILSNVLSSQSVCTLGRPSTSDHSPVLLTTRGPLEPDEIKPNFIYRELFQNYLVNNLSTQCLEGNWSKSETDLAVKHLTDTHNRVSLCAIPLKTELSIQCKLYPHSTSHCLPHMQPCQW